MNQPLQTEQRIVSKGEYAQVQVRRAKASLSGLACLFVASICVITAIALLTSVVYRVCFPGNAFSDIWCRLEDFVFVDWSRRQPEAFINTMLINGLSISSLIGLAYLHATHGRACIKDAIRLNPGVPFTRANTADLPASDSLVRASEEPKQEQAVLLRPAVQGQETPPEQLVRAAGKQELL